MKVLTTSFLLVSFVSAFTVSCRSYDESRLREAPAFRDNPALMGGSTEKTWDMLKDDLGAEVDVPWTDTYWPLASKGVADRWTLDHMSTGFDEKDYSRRPISPWAQVSQMNEIWASKNTSSIAGLSPAEKYDILKDPSILVPENFDQLKKQHVEMIEGSKIEELASLQKNTIDSYRQIAERYSLANETYEKYRTEFSEKYATVESLSAVLASEVSETKKAELEQKISGLQSDLKDLISKIDVMSAEIEKIEIEMVTLRSQYTQSESELGKIVKKFSGPIEKVATELESKLYMVGHSWKEWASFSGTFDSTSEWGWMGHCHGWAPASIYEKKPKHAVMVKNSEREILFTQGDIRGLLTKVWADQSPPSVFVGERCNTDDLEHDQYGRILDGRICEGEVDACSGEAVGKAMYISSSKLSEGLVIFSDKPRSSESKIGLVIGRGKNQTYKLAVYESITKFNEKLSALNAGDYSESTIMTANITKNCRDTNPMTLHLALHEQIKQQKRGFVMDKTRTSQVWNQPVYKYQIEHLAITKSDGSVSKAGEPVSVDEIDDPFKAYRAEGTRYMVQLKNDVFYGVENGPKLEYQNSDEAFGVDTFFYTLELDESKKIIGGEWGVIPSKEPSDEAVENMIRATAPDFIWMVKKGDTPKKGPIDYTLIDKIHRCSLDTNKPRLVSYPYKDGRTVQYVECEL